VLSKNFAPYRLVKVTLLKFVSRNAKLSQCVRGVRLLKTKHFRRFFVFLKIEHISTSVVRFLNKLSLKVVYQLVLCRKRHRKAIYTTYYQFRILEKPWVLLLP